MADGDSVPALDGELTSAVQAWLDELTRRAEVGDRYGPDLELAATAAQLVDDDRRREGILLRPGRLTVARLDAHESGLVDLEATIAYPADAVVRNRRAAPSRALDGLTVRLGATYWARDVFDRWQLMDYVRDDRRMSATWCTHPVGQDADAAAGLGVVPQAITVDAAGKGGARVGRLFLEVQNERDAPVVLRVGRPERPPGLFRRPPPVTAPEVGIPVPAGGSVHLVGRTSRPRLTEVELFAFDPSTGEPVGQLRVQAELPRHHPGEDGDWCGEVARPTE
ncbi:MAG TPA: hypothetical protein VLR26_14340 [Frankiaceae bacterium]|nr:hypothetical protein [Frankiaceae bacterium]